jgi:hypothetical protein
VVLIGFSRTLKGHGEPAYDIKDGYFGLRFPSSACFLYWVT